jgi:hypothetical protein
MQNRCYASTSVDCFSLLPLIKKTYGDWPKGGAANDDQVGIAGDSCGFNCQATIGRQGLGGGDRADEVADAKPHDQIVLDLSKII